MSETLDNATTPQRPTFLTVLCILTFIGSGLGLIGSLVGLIGSSLPGISMFVTKGSMISQVFALLAAALCLFGAVKMWGLVKQGFTFYLLGCLLSIVGTIVAAVTMGSYLASTMGELNQLSDDSAELGNAFAASATAIATAAAWMAVVWSVIINGLFIILYAVNKKHLVK
jgi:hypothetical protein